MPRGPKSRNGCGRCKKHRLKCDEAKPACGRCTRLGSSCPGPVHKLRWSNKHEVFRMENEDSHPHNPSSPCPALEDNISSSAPKSPLSHTNASLLISSPPSGCSTMFGGQFSQRPEELLQFTDDDWNSQLIGQLFPGFLDTVDDSFVSFFSTSNAPHEDVIQQLDPQAPASKSLSLPTLAPTSSVDAHSHVVAKPKRQQTSRHDVLQASQVHSKEMKRTKRSKAIFVPLIHVPKDNATMLVEFYFSGTAQAYSVYDSDMNPFRSTVSRLWDSSRVIYLSLQSMAAACLVGIYPALASTGEQLRREALDLLASQESKGDFDDKALLALLMIGGTSGWHDPRDKGVSLFHSFRRHVERMRISGQLVENSNSLRFFQESLMYWEMLLAYVVDDDKLERSKSELTTSDLTVSPTDTASQSQSPRVPHPWTGFARDTQMLVLEIGRLVRSQRLRAHRRSFTTHAAVSQLQSEMMRASELEAALLSTEPLTESEVVSPDDRQTPVWHLLNLAEVYCHVGLIQLYRVFPDLLRARLEAESQPTPSCYSDNDTSDHRLAGTEDDNTSQAACNEWLTTFSLQTLGLLAPIPVESGTRDFQPFLLVACCSELRYPSGNVPPQTSEVVTASDCQISMRVVEISKARALILSRLQAFLHCLPPKPIRRCIDIVEATWKIMDEQNKEENRSFENDAVYWMDVMIAKGWETTMG